MKTMIGAGDRVDVAIVGAGAAGIAAATRLADRGHRVLLIEAMDRLGGRAHTIEAGGVPLDLGCGWLHSADRNPLVAVAEAAGVQVDRHEAAWDQQIGNDVFSAADQYEAWAAYEGFGDVLRASPPPDDRAGGAIAADARWRPFIDAMSGFINGIGIDRLSAADFVAYENAATEHNWRLPGGYGTFLSGLATRLPHALATRVTAIERAGSAVRIMTDRGTILAGAAIVTVSTTVLAAGTIRFDPPTDDHLHAAACLPLGLADKLFLQIAEPDAVPPETHLLGRVDRAATGSYYLRPLGRPVIECFLGGDHAHALEVAGEAAAVEFAVEELAALLGRDFANGLTPLAYTRWAAEPTIGGSYSHALPGHAAMRAVLERPVDERLCFAGEACSPADFSTAHGAWTSGLAAADHVEAVLRVRAEAPPV